MRIITLWELLKVTSDSRALGALAPWSERTASAEFSSSYQRLVPAVYQPRRSTLVNWTVRMAQMFDSLVSRARPANLPSAQASGAMVRTTLRGLDRCCRLIPQHHQVVAAERARLQIVNIVQRRRARYDQFLEVWRSMSEEDNQLDGKPNPLGQLEIHLNPACCWMPLDAGPGLTDQSTAGNSALFFLIEADLRAVRMNLEGQVLINELADYQPCTIYQWAHVSSMAQADELTTLVQKLAGIGLVAIG